MKIRWVTSWNRKCGIADYSKSLFPEVKRLCDQKGWQIEVVSLDEFRTPGRLLRHLVNEQPDLIHFQHEYGLFGGKNPPFYIFPRLKRALGRRLRNCRMVATAHTVIAEDYRYPLNRSAWQIPLRAAVNATLLPWLARIWGRATWGDLANVYVHSRHQMNLIRSSGQERVETIAHFVPESKIKSSAAANGPVVVFGFFTPDKGQDLAIEAWARLPKEFQNRKLILAGGVRTRKDKAYFKTCVRKIKRLGLGDSVEITGFIPIEKASVILAEASLVLSPFRETTGSGSLAMALSMGCPVLTSDHAINAELNERVDGAVELFKRADIENLVQRLQDLMGDQNRRLELKNAALKYANLYSIPTISQRIVNSYERVLGQNLPFEFAGPKK
ncbi:MAG: glycosyltransferase [Oligoflexia bacterium]|nr:glycosyltransferase [Oligoflexia bacterium]